MQGWKPTAILIAVIALLPVFLSRHDTDLAVLTAIHAIAGLGVGMLLGQCGIVSLAQSAFFGIGGYASAIGTTSLGLPIGVSLVTGMLVSGAIAFLIGWPILRLTGFFLALATLALAVIASTLFYEWDWLTGGTVGISGIPKLHALGFVAETPTSFYYIAWGALGLLTLLARNIITGNTGLAMRAVRDSPEAAMALAINLHAIRVRIFVICAVYGSIAGSLYAHYTNYVGVSGFTVEHGILFLLIPVLGGSRSLIGPPIGALFVTFMPEVLSFAGELHGVLFGLALVAVVLFMPQGVAGGLTTLWNRSRLGVRNAAG